MNYLFYAMIFNAFALSGQVITITDEEEEETRWDSIFRLSDLPGAYGTAGNRPYYQTIPGRKVGCVCMDNSRGKTWGRGACSGHGGVRYWLSVEAGKVDTTWTPTERHRQHPKPLDNDEMASLAWAAPKIPKATRVGRKDTTVMMHQFPGGISVPFIGSDTTKPYAQSIATHLVVPDTVVNIHQTIVDKTDQTWHLAQGIVTLVFSCWVTWFLVTRQERRRYLREVMRHEAREEARKRARDRRKRRLGPPPPNTPPTSQTPPTSDP